MLAWAYQALGTVTTGLGTLVLLLTVLYFLAALSAKLRAVVRAYRVRKFVRHYLHAQRVTPRTRRH